MEEVKIGLPPIIGTNLYPMESLGGITVEEGTIKRGTPVELNKLYLLQTRRVRDVAKNGYEAWRFDCEVKDTPERTVLSIPSLDATYVESGAHIFQEAEIPQEILSRKGGDTYKARIVHVNLSHPEIQLGNLEQVLKKVTPGDALIVNTQFPEEMGYTDYWMQNSGGVIIREGYNLESPYFSPEAMEAISKSEIHLLAGNFPSFSNPDGGTSIEMLELFFKQPGRVILAPLLNLKKLRETGPATLKLNPMRTSEKCCSLLCDPVVTY